MPPFIERDQAFFQARSIPEPNSGCWLWSGHVGKDGYAKVVFRGRCSSASRVSYIAHHGEIDPGNEVDHLCHMPSCVNPDHLVSVSRAENCKRRKSNGYGARTCLRGHEIAGVDNRGRSFCIECQRAATRRYKARVRARKVEAA